MKEAILLDYRKVKTYAQMSAAAASVLLAQLTEKPESVLGLATGSTPIGMYDRLAEEYAAGRADFSRMTTVNLDEYCGLAPDNDQSYRYFMDRHLFDRINVDKSRTFVPDGMAADPAAECAAYDRRIEELGGIDLQVLGIGNNGHIGFNEPAEAFTPETHRVALKESTIRANARFFDRPEDVPTHALTTGIRAILQAKTVLLLAGKGKKEILERALFGPVTPQVPASILQLHPNVIAILAEEE